VLYKKLRFHLVDSFDFISLVGTFPFVVSKVRVFVWAPIRAWH
jgi:hypothetical protein